MLDGENESIGSDREGCLRKCRESWLGLPLQRDGTEK